MRMYVAGKHFILDINMTANASFAKKSFSCSNHVSQIQGTKSTQTDSYNC